MTVRFQWQDRGDAKTDWRQGSQEFEPIWVHAHDFLRFHKGAGFEVTGPNGVTHAFPLRQVGGFLEKAMKTHSLDSVYIVKSKHDGYALAFRRHEVVDPARKQYLDYLKAAHGAPYVLGAAGPTAYDCSGLTLAGVRLVTGILLPHKAGSATIPSQLHDSHILHISRDNLEPGDLLFHWGNQSECDHVSTFLDYDGPGGNGRVIDTEPHSTNAPAGWPTSTTGVGVQVRPMNPGWYTDWAHVVAIGRIVKINGQPGG